MPTSRSSGKEGVRDIATGGSIMRVRTYDGLLSCPECGALFSSPEDLIFDGESLARLAPQVGGRVVAVCEDVEPDPTADYCPSLLNRRLNSSMLGDAGGSLLCRLSSYLLLTSSTFSLGIPVGSQLAFG